MTTDRQRVNCDEPLISFVFVCQTEGQSGADRGQALAPFHTDVAQWRHFFVISLKYS